MNEQCARKKFPPKFRYQAPLVAAANRAARAAASQIGFPLLDWSQMTQGDDPGLTCPTTGDGVHVKQWVDALRAQLYLSYLCEHETSTFRPPASVRDVSAKFNAVRARCPLSTRRHDGRRRRPALGEAEAARLAKDREARLSYNLGLRSKGKRVSSWMLAAANGSCIYE